MDRALRDWTSEIGDVPPEWKQMAQHVKKSYVVYGNMVLISWSAFASLPDFSSDLIQEDPKLQRLYAAAARHLKATHVATTRPIPLTISGEKSARDNVLRSPTQFLPLLGNFGPDSCTDVTPSEDDFATAFWTTAKQNGILQTWAPRWTMFSRGNISEKARLLSCPSVLHAVNQGRMSGRGTTAIDLYVGIGYFAFSYAKAGVDVVWGWDLNPWSIEGCRRGALVNRWTIEVVDSSGATPAPERSRLVIFNESNAHATRRISEVRDDLPPIQHVNCGLLPTSRASWPIAVEALDSDLDGWVHIHENWAVVDIDTQVRKLKNDLQDLVAVAKGSQWSVDIEHIHQVKSYAPGVMHCVIDVHIFPDLG